MPYTPHLGITCITMLKPLIYKALRRFYGVMAMNFLVSPSITPYITRVCGVFHWNRRISTEMRKISIEVRGLCCDYAAKFSDNVPRIGTPTSTHLVRIQCTTQRHLRESLILRHCIHNITICNRMTITLVIHVRQRISMNTIVITLITAMCRCSSHWLPFNNIWTTIHILVV